VVDSASIEVNRRARRAKTDRLDSDKLLSMLMRYYAGERRVWAVARIPTPEQEDDRRLHRELERLRKEQTAHTNRIRSLLVLHNLRVRSVGGRIWTHWWTRQRELLAPGLRAEIDRECERLVLVHQQIRLLEVQQERQVRSGAHPGMALLAQLAGIGAGSAWTLVRELFGWRQFRNRREVASCLGLTPTPYASGTSEVELGISQGGQPAMSLADGRARLELAAPAARQPAQPLVQRALCRYRQADAAHRYRRARTPSGDRPVALSRARRNPRRCDTQAARRQHLEGLND
jgi:transposase